MEPIQSLTQINQHFITGLIVSVVDPQPGDTIVDCCAAPGGKTLFMASRLKSQGDLI